MSFNKEQILRKVYYNPKTGFEGAEKLYNKANKIDPRIDREDADKFIKRQEIYQLHLERKNI